MISFVIPAHNEEAALPRTLTAIHATAQTLALNYEIILVNDASTDRTAQVALAHQAQVLDVAHRKISATRNSGARAARGDRIFFIDADTTINPRAVSAALRAMDRGAVGGGATVWFDRPIPLYIQVISLFAGPLAKLIGFTGGAFMFCTKSAFDQSGGFDERLFCAEEGGFALALRKQGPFVVLWQRVLTSGRRVRTMSAMQLLRLCIKGALNPRALTQREAVQKIWYESNRANDHILPNSLPAKISNALALIVILALASGPIWSFIPRAWTPLGTPIGELRFAIRFLIAHFGLLLWPCAIALFVNLFKRRLNWEWLKIALLTAACAWQAFACTRAMLYVWGRIFRSLQ